MNDFGWGWILGFLSALAVSYAPQARADTWGVATVGSYHTRRDSDYNERNWGVGVEHELSDTWRATVGGYRNSYYKDSFYAMGLWLPVQRGQFRFGAGVGIVTGYDRIVGPFAPAVLPTITYEEKNWGANLGIMPSPTRGIEALGLQIKRRF